MHRYTVAAEPLLEESRHRGRTLHRRFDFGKLSLASCCHRLDGGVSGENPLTATGAPSYQAFRLMNGEAFLPQLMIGFMLFAVALSAGSLALRRARTLSISAAILVPASFVA